ncbi:MAG: TonB-dependent receptor [Winogradskyella sp.]|nr:TonB-dependent receptor [Winogradskyella sp.]
MHTRIKTTAYFLFLFWTCASFAQGYEISGRIFDNNQSPISFANVILLTQNDSTFVKGTSTDDLGYFTINNVEGGSYILKTSFIGFKDVFRAIDVNKDIDLGPIVLEEDALALNQINITVKRPTITRQPDRLTFNVANTALIEGSTLQVLRSTPGIIVSEGSINIKSSPATVYINQRKVQLTSDELIQLLENSPANSIKSIEVITSPPASYDADSGSVINIIMSKNLITGYRGSVFTNYTQGVFPRYNAGTSHFFKNEKINFNINYSYNQQKINRSNDDEVNFLETENTREQFWFSDVNRNTWSNNHNLNLNFDYFINDKNTISISSTGLYTPYFKYKINNNTVIDNGMGDFVSRFTADNLSRDNKYNIGTDLDYLYESKSNARLAVNAHFTIYDYERDQNVFSNFYDMNNELEDSSEFNTLANQNTEIITSKLDYSVPINEKSTFEAGAKFSNVKTDSDITRVDIINGSEVVNDANSDAFNYDEKVYAAYLNYSLSSEKWSFNLGLRTEQTDIVGTSITLNEATNQNYLRWFPNAGLSVNISDNFSLYSTYKRSIQRPSYTALNPFTFFLNENTVVVGNPNLTPTFIDHITVGTTLLKYLTFEAYYMNYDGAINELPRQDNENNILAYTPVNLDKTVEYGFDFVTDFYLTNRWSVYFVTSFYNVTEETSFGEDIVELSQWSNYSALSNNINLLKDNSLNINFDVTFGGKNLQRLQIVENRLISNLRISKSMFNKKGVLSLSVQDLFNEQDFRSSVNYLNQRNSMFTNLDNRLISLGFRYKFGNTRLSTNERVSELDERNRLKDLN